MALETTNVKETAPAVTGAERMRSGMFYRPNVDILEVADELLVLADVPGAGVENIDIRFEDGLLTIHARVPQRQGQQHFAIQEYGVGDFYRTFEISEAIDAAQISAECGEGVLTLHLPKAEALKPRKIAVKAN